MSLELGAGGGLQIERGSATGIAIGSPISGASSDEVLYIDASGNLAVDPSFTYTNQSLSLPGYIQLSSNPAFTPDVYNAWFWNQGGLGPTISGASFQVQTSGSTPALFIDSTQNTTFLGSVTAFNVTLQDGSSNRAFEVTTNGRTAQWNHDLSIVGTSPQIAGSAVLINLTTHDNSIFYQLGYGSESQGYIANYVNGSPNYPTLEFDFYKTDNSTYIGALQMYSFGGAGFADSTHYGANTQGIWMYSWGTLAFGEVSDYTSPTTNTVWAKVTSTALTAASFVKSGATNLQFLMGDGTVAGVTPTSGVGLALKTTQYLSIVLNGVTYKLALCV